MVHYIENDRINEEVLKNKNKLVVVDFFATWCMPCEELSYILTRIEKKYCDEVEFYKVNVEDSEETSVRYAINATPTIIFFKYGEEVEREVGLLGEKELENIIEDLK